MGDVDRSVFSESIRKTWSSIIQGFGLSEGVIEGDVDRSVLPEHDHHRVQVVWTRPHCGRCGTIDLLFRNMIIAGGLVCFRGQSSRKSCFREEASNTKRHWIKRMEGRCLDEDFRKRGFRLFLFVVWSVDVRWRLYWLSWLSERLPGLCFMFLVVFYIYWMVSNGCDFYVSHCCH